MKTARSVSLICVVGMLVGLPASGKDKHARAGDEEPPRSQDEGSEAKGGKHRGFSDDERQQIQTYCQRFGQQEGKHPRSLPPGLAKKERRGGKLPPGWEDKCTPGQIMPVEVYQECHPLPPELTVKLPVPPVGTVTVAVGGRIVRLIEATREILDVFNIHAQF